MSSAAPTPERVRPREVTLGGMLTVVGSTITLAMLVGTMAELNSAAMQDALQQFVDEPPADTLGLTVDDARAIVKYTIMALAVVSGASLVLGFFVLRKDRSARIALTVLGGLVMLVSLLGGPAGWALTVYIAIVLGLLWSRRARAWFAKPAAPGTGFPGGYAPPGWPPPSPPPPPPPPPGKR